MKEININEVEEYRNKMTDAEVAEVCLFFGLLWKIQQELGKKEKVHD